MDSRTLPADLAIRVDSLLTGPGIQGVWTARELVVSPAAFVRLSMGESVEVVVATGWDRTGMPRLHPLPG